MIDEQLISNIKNNACNSSLNELIHKHTGLCYDIYRKYLPSQELSGNLSINVENDKDLVIYKSAMSFDPSKKVKFCTWLGNQIRYQCLNLLRKKKSKSHVISLEEDKLEDMVARNDEYVYNSACSNESKSLTEYVTSVISQMKDSRVKKIFDLRYFSKTGKKMPWQKIGETLGISAPTAINIHEKALILIRRKVNSDNISDTI
jgi:RNA polymerase sigma factor (sigma-70 family)